MTLVIFNVVSVTLTVLSLKQFYVHLNNFSLMYNNINKYFYSFQITFNHT